MATMPSASPRAHSRRHQGSRTSGATRIALNGLEYVAMPSSAAAAIWGHIPSGIRVSLDVDERNTPVRAETKRLAALQEDALGSAVIEPLEPFKITLLEAEVAVKCGAQRCRHVYRFVALDFPGDSGRDVDRIGG